MKKFKNELPMTDSEANEVKCYIEEIEEKLDEIKRQERWARMKLQAMRERIGDNENVSFKEINDKFIQDIDGRLKIIELVAF